MAGAQEAGDVTLFRSTATPTHTRTNERYFTYLPVLEGEVQWFACIWTWSHFYPCSAVNATDNLMSWYRDSTTKRSPTTAVQPSISSDVAADVATPSPPRGVLL